VPLRNDASALFTLAGTALSVLLCFGAPPALADLYVETGADVVHDSNVWRYSDGDRDLYDLVPESALFTGVSSLSDVIVSPYVYASLDQWKTNGIRYGLEVYAERYARNEVLDFTAARAELTTRAAGSRLTLYAEHRPNLYVGETRPDPDATSTRQEFVTQNRVGFRLTTEHGPVRWTTKGGLSFDDYSGGFDSQDGERYRIGAAARIWPRGKFSVDTQYLYELREAGPRLEVESSPTGLQQVVTNDLSSARDIWELQLTGRIGARLTAYARYRLDYKRYTTDSPADDDHYGRRDTTRDLRAGIRLRLRPHWRLGASVGKRSRAASVQPEIYDYEARTTTLSAAYIF